jgi:translation initiation factor IF-3
VRLVDENGNQVGVVPTRQALDMAREAGLDLVEVSPQAKPPVCKILDYGKYKFQLQKKASEARKNQQIVTVKEITIRPRTDDHDYDVKMKNARKFLERGDKVKFNLRFRGREMAHQDLGLEMMARIESDLQDVAKVDQKPRQEGRNMNMLLSPASKK